MSDRVDLPWEALAVDGSFLAELSREDRHVLRSRTEEYLCAENESLIRVGDPGDRIYLVLEGGVSIERAIQPGKPKIIETRNPGELVGMLAFFTGAANQFAARCTADSRLAVMSRSTFDALLVESPGLWRALQAFGLRRMRQLQLSSHLDRLFGPFGVMLPYVLQDIEDEIRWVTLRSGETLFRQGEPCTGAFILMTGRLQMAVESAEGREVIENTVLAGETVGEVALLTEEPHGQTVYAARDSELVQLSPHSFQLMLQRNTRAIHNVSRIMGRRMAKVRQEHDPSRIPIRCISLIAAGAGLDLSAFAAGLEAQLGAFGSTVHLNSQMVGRELGAPAIAQADESEAAGLRLTQWLGEQEAAWRYLVYQGDSDWTAWSARCVRQTDQVVVVADARGGPCLDQLEQHLSGPRQRWSLVLLHPSDCDRPRGTARWLQGSRAESVFHVRQDNQADLSRLARILSGNAVSLVLGGGGARGFAHIGVLRALEELGVSVDMVGGTSMGAPIAGWIAQGLNSAQCNERAQHAFDKIIDLTLPLASMIAGHRISKTIKKQTGGWDIEDYWLPYFCVSTNLTTAKPVTHRSGNSWRAIRASVSIPGVMPPVPADGDLLVDGGVLNNLPIDVMREMNPFGTVIAIDVVPPRGPSASSDYGTSLSGWHLLASKLLPGKKPVGVPGVATTILQSLVLGSALKRQQMLEQGLADLYLNIQVSAVGLLQFDARDRAAQAGYDGSLEPLREWAERNHTVPEK